MLTVIFFQHFGLFILASIVANEKPDSYYFAGVFLFTGSFLQFSLCSWCSESPSRYDQGWVYDLYFILLGSLWAKKYLVFMPKTITGIGTSTILTDNRDLPGGIGMSQASTEGHGHLVDNEQQHDPVLAFWVAKQHSLPHLLFLFPLIIFITNEVGNGEVPYWFLTHFKCFL